MPLHRVSSLPLLQHWVSQLCLQQCRHQPIACAHQYNWSLLRLLSTGTEALSTRPASTASPNNSQDLTIHSSAVARLTELQQKNKSQLALRIEVESGGCSGFQYKFSLENHINDDDLVFQKDGAKVVCDDVSLQFLKGAVVEFEDSLMRSAFVVSKNPNSDASCGCGSSFAVKAA